MGSQKQHRLLMPTLVHPHSPHLPDCSWCRSRHITLLCPHSASPLASSPRMQLVMQQTHRPFMPALTHPHLPLLPEFSCRSRHIALPCPRLCIPSFLVSHNSVDATADGLPPLHTRPHSCIPTRLVSQNAVGAAAEVVDHPSHRFLHTRTRGNKKRDREEGWRRGRDGEKERSKGGGRGKQQLLS